MVKIWQRRQKFVLWSILAIGLAIGLTTLFISHPSFAQEASSSAKVAQSSGIGVNQAVRPSDPAAMEDMHFHLDGKTLSILWGLPFVGILLSIALGPQLFSHFWEHHYGKVAALWALIFLIPAYFTFGGKVMTFMVVETLFREYIPFVLLLLALFVVSGGIRLGGHIVGKPIVNVIFLGIGTLLASLMGTTGAAMLLIRPLIRANDHRRYKIHTIVFFIFLVANVGGSLTPLGDPPLFLGFLAGIDFFWTAEHMFLPWIVTSLLLLIAYIAFEIHFFAKEPEAEVIEMEEEDIAIDGKHNILFLAGVVAAVLMSGTWHTNKGLTIYHVFVPLPELMRDLILIGIALLSWVSTSHAVHQRNEYSWEPIVEVAKLFAGIFLTIMPVIASLKAGTEGALGGIVALVSDAGGNPIDWRYFWLTGLLSSFLDNAPTYLVFFNTASGDPYAMMHELTSTLLAISGGAVFFGAMTYIGNAPNFMVRSIAISRGVKMPSFFGYMAWSVSILVPILLLDTFIFWE